MSCTLDRVDEGAIDRTWQSVREAIKKQYKLTDAEIDATLAGFAAEVGRNKQALGTDLRQCGSVRINRLVSLLMVGVLLVALVVNVMLIRRDTPALWNTFEWLNLVLTFMTVFQLRHIVRLLLKLAWHGFGSNTRVLLVITLITLGANSLLNYYKFGGSRTVLVTLLGVLVATTLVRLYAVTQAVVHPESAVFVAAASALDRSLTRRKIRAIHNLLG